jgi:high-affinity iron transporter
VGAAFVVTLREAFEAALILGLVYTYLDKVGGRAYYRYATAGGALGLLASIAAGVAVGFLSGPLLDLGPDVVSAVVVFAAVILLTWHGWWMRQHARSIKGNVQRRIDQARLTRRLWIIGLIAFTGVFREGAETILFLWGLLTQATSSVAGIAGGALGVATAALLGWAIFRGGTRLSPPRFFTITSAILLLVSAGLFSAGVGQLQGLGVVPQSQALWDTSFLLSDQSLVGAFVSGLLGYRARPSALEVGAYVTYVAVAGLLLFGNVLVPARQRSEPRPDVARP